MTAGLFAGFLFLVAMRLMIFRERQLCGEAVQDPRRREPFARHVLLARFQMGAEFRALQSKKKESGYTLC